MGIMSQSSPRLFFDSLSGNQCLRETCLAQEQHDSTRDKGRHFLLFDQTVCVSSNGCVTYNDYTLLSTSSSSLTHFFTSPGGKEHFSTQESCIGLQTNRFVPVPRLTCCVLGPHEHNTCLTFSLPFSEGPSLGFQCPLAAFPSSDYTLEKGGTGFHESMKSVPVLQLYCTVTVYVWWVGR